MKRGARAREKQCDLCTGCFALAWRQSEDLAGAGIPRERLAALSVFLDRANREQIALDRNSVVVDELGQLGTRQMQQHGFQLVAVGDLKQCQAIEAGPVIDLLRSALGSEAVPELLSTLRQQSARERETSLLFRAGQAVEALARKREDGTAQIVPGGYREAVEQAAALWQERRQANAHDPGYTLTVSAPTNADAREIAAAIRVHRHAAGELEPDQVVLQAADVPFSGPWQKPVAIKATFVEAAALVEFIEQDYALANRQAEPNSVPSIFFIISIGVSISIAVLGAPLFLGRVSPNRLYGVRTPASASSPEAWYELNRAVGVSMMVSGLISALLVSAAWPAVHVSSEHKLGFGVIVTCLLTGSIVLGQLFRATKRIKNSHNSV